MLSFRPTDMTNSKANTKRTILANTAKLFDPLGLLAPLIEVPKLILQESWQQKLDWDDTVSPNIYTKWLAFEEA